MNSNVIESLSKSLEILKFKITAEEISSFMLEKDFSETHMQACSEVFYEFAERNENASVNFLLNCSRLPMKNPKTFENFDFTELSGKGVKN